MAVCGVSEETADHTKRTAAAAIDMLAALDVLEVTMSPESGDKSWVKDVGEIQVRIGLHCGPVVAGVVGAERLQYDVWGDTVNVASRMEGTGEAGKIHISEDFARALPGEQFDFAELKPIDVKGKGLMKTYFLN